MAMSISPCKASLELTRTEGVEVVGPLPGDLGRTTVFAAGVGAHAGDNAASGALVRFLASPEGQAVFKAKGFDPG